MPETVATYILPSFMFIYGRMARIVPISTSWPEAELKPTLLTISKETLEEHLSNHHGSSNSSRYNAVGSPTGPEFCHFFLAVLGLRCCVWTFSS